MDLNEVKDLINRIENSNLTEFELKLNNAYVKMSKLTNSSPQSTQSAQSVQEMQAEPTTILPDETPAVMSGKLVTAPIVGTFYASPTPDKPNFVKVGDRVSKGDVLCIVEAMKVMNEIASEFDGQIAEICVENEQMVEYGQSLFRIV